MPVYCEALRRKSVHVAGAGVDVEYTVAAMTPEVVMVLVAGKFVAGWLAWQFYQLGLACFHKLLDVAVDRG